MSVSSYQEGNLLDLSRLGLGPENGLIRFPIPPLEGDEVIFFVSILVVAIPTLLYRCYLDRADHKSVTLSVSASGVHRDRARGHEPAPAPSHLLFTPAVHHADT